MRFPLLSKLGAMALVVIMVMCAIWRIEGLVDERHRRSLDAREGVEQSHAKAQVVVGPLLARRCVEEVTTTTQVDGHPVSQVVSNAFALVQPPTTLAVAGRTRMQPLHRGLFKVNAYDGLFDAVAEFSSFEALRPRAAHGGRVTCEAVRLMMSPSDVRGVRAVDASVDGKALEVQAGIPTGSLPRGFSAALPTGRGEPGDAAVLTAHVKLDLAGTSALSWVPAAGTTTWKLGADWPHPSFGGRFLPAERTVHDDGFEATWRLSALATDAPEQVAKGDTACVEALADDPENLASGRRFCIDTMTVSYIDPVNPYVLSDRAVKYALLFVVLTFVAVGLVEVLSGRRVHPVQYLLVGLALSLFFLLLLSLSEQLPFGVAYGFAAAACVGLLAFYASSMFGRRGAGFGFGAGAALLYGLLYALLQREQDALAIGSVMLFAALATVMGLTRRLDWYELFARVRRADAPR